MPTARASRPGICLRTATPPAAHRILPRIPSALDRSEGVGRKAVVLSFLIRFKQIRNHPSQPPPGYAVRGTGESTHPVYLWWFAFNQLPDLPQQLLAGKSRLLIDWLFDSQLRNPAAISERDRAIYAAAYSQPDAIRAGNGWDQTFGQDLIDAKQYS